MNQQNPINETVNTFFEKWTFDENPVRVLGHLLNSFLEDPFSCNPTDVKEKTVLEQISKYTLSVGLLMRLFYDLEENNHVKNYANTRVHSYFLNFSQEDQDNIRELLVHYISANEKQSFEIALTVPGVGAIMEFLNNLQKSMNKKEPAPVELN